LIPLDARRSASAFTWSARCFRLRELVLCAGDAGSGLVLQAEDLLFASRFVALDPGIGVGLQLGDGGLGLHPQLVDQPSAPLELVDPIGPRAAGPTASAPAPWRGRNSRSLDLPLLQMRHEAGSAGSGGLARKLAHRRAD